MTCQQSQLLHLRKFPDNDLIQRVAVSADQLVYVFTEHQVTHLRPRVNALRLRACERVPESNGSVGSATS